MTFYTPHPLPPRVVLTYGSFDMFHQGHVRLLHHLSSMGTELIVGCATDAYNRTNGRDCLMPYAERRAVLESCRFVSRVIAEESWEQKRSDIVNYNVSVLAMGDEWAGQFDGLGDLAQVIYLPRGQSQTARKIRADYGMAALAG
ncbi:MAG: adenylyltransferase/cytidyltransferase family protein [Sulfitobacter sp.]